MRHDKTLRSLAALSVLVSAGALALTGCAGLPLDAITHRETVEYKNAKEAFADKDSHLPKLSWLPADATDIRMTQRTDGPGYMIRFTSPSGFPSMEGEACVAVGPEVPALEPAISDSGWPDKLPTADRHQCREGTMEIARDGDTWYYWRADVNPPLTTPTPTP